MNPLSKIYLVEAIPNSRRKTNGAKEYYPVLVQRSYGVVHSALFSQSQIDTAIERAYLQPEDAPEIPENVMPSRFKAFMRDLLHLND